MVILIKVLSAFTVMWTLALLGALLSVLLSQMCWLCCCTSTVFFFVFCMFGLHAIEKDMVIIPHFDCDFVYFFFSLCQVCFKVMFCYHSWIFLSKISLLKVHLIIIMKIPSLIQLVYLGLKSTFWDIDLATPVLLQLVHFFHRFTFKHSLLS